MKEELTLIRISARTRDKIKKLAAKKKLKNVTILEYLLSGKIPLEDLKQI